MAPGKRRRARSAASIQTVASCSSGCRCPKAWASAGSNPTARTCSTPAAGRAEKSAPCAAPNAVRPDPAGPLTARLEIPTEGKRAIHRMGALAELTLFSEKELIMKAAENEKSITQRNLANHQVVWPNRSLAQSKKLLRRERKFTSL